MTYFPEGQEYNPAKEAILARSPFTRIFLDRQMSQDSETWSAYLSAAEVKINNELTSIFGKDWEITSVAPLTVMVNNLHLVNPELSYKVVHNGVRAITEIGFELGNNEDCKTLLEDLTFQLRDTGFLNMDTISDLAVREKMVEMIVALLQIGVYYRLVISNDILDKNNLSSPPSTPPAPSDDDPNLQVFRNFLNKLK